MLTSANTMAIKKTFIPTRIKLNQAVHYYQNNNKEEELNQKDLISFNLQTLGMIYKFQIHTMIIIRMLLVGKPS